MEYRSGDAGGEGPDRPEHANPPSHPARLRRRGRILRYTVAEFESHPAHDHYHFDDWGRYELWTKADYDAWVSSGGTTGSPMLGSKTTSCIIDEEFIRQLPRQPYPPVYNFRGCQPDANWRMIQGISPGWGDTYDYYRTEQWIDLGPQGTLPAGQYVLRSVTDPAKRSTKARARAIRARRATRTTRRSRPSPSAMASSSTPIRRAGP